jgi:peptide/nickel transport system ATP-binding protein
MNRFPHQFSGGQRQRISIARALAVRPKILICDESIAALDVSIQAQIINLFMELKQKFKLTYLFISHDISVVQHIADRVAVMYLGRILEIIQAEDLFDKPNHPYTQALLSAIPKVEAKRRAFKSVEGEIPSPLDPPSGCHFHQRCPHVMEVCRQNIPKLEQIDPDHFSACHLNNDGSSNAAPP